MMRYNTINNIIILSCFNLIFSSKLPIIKNKTQNLNNNIVEKIQKIRWTQQHRIKFYTIMLLGLCCLSFYIFKARIKVQNNLDVIDLKPKNTDTKLLDPILITISETIDTKSENFISETISETIDTKPENFISETIHRKSESIMTEILKKTNTTKKKSVRYAVAEYVPTIITDFTQAKKEFKNRGINIKIEAKFYKEIQGREILDDIIRQLQLLYQCINYLKNLHIDEIEIVKNNLVEYVVLKNDKDEKRTLGIRKIDTKHQKVTLLYLDTCLCRDLVCEIERKPFRRIIDS